MRLEELNQPFRGFVADLVERRFGTDHSRFSAHVAVSDEMFVKAILPGYGSEMNISLFNYVESCLRMFDVYRQIVEQAFGGFKQLRSMRDFGSGYARLTRSVVHRLDREGIWVADLHAQAMT